MSRAAFAEAAIRHIALGARAARRGRTPRRDHRPQCRSRSAGLARSFVRLQEKGRVVFTATLAGRPMPVTARRWTHGSRSSTASRPRIRAPFRRRRGWPPNAAELLDWVARLVPPRAPVTGASPISRPPRVPHSDRATAEAFRAQLNLVKRPAPVPDFVELAYETREWTPGASAH